MAALDDEKIAKDLTPIDRLVGGDESDTKLLKSMASGAQQYLLSFRWCKGIREAYFADGYGGIIAIFFVRIEPSQPNIDEWLWVVYGRDFPPAYLVTDTCKSPLQAFERYLSGLADWIQLAKQGKSAKDTMPICVPSTLENAEELEPKLTFLRQAVLPQFQIPRG
jgi:hypothetical protein